MFDDYIIELRSLGVSEFNSQLSNSLTPQLQIYDLSGRLVKSLPITDYRLPITEVTWDGTDDFNREVKNGVYFCKLITNKEWVGAGPLTRITKKIIKIKL